MNRVTYYTACSLDGFLATEDDSLDWLFRQRIDEDGPMNHGAFMAGVGALVMGATTYGWVVDHGERTGEPWAYTVPTWVVTHRQFPPTENDVRFVSGSVDSWWSDVTASAGDREIWVVGGGDLAGQIADALSADGLGGEGVLLDAIVESFNIEVSAPTSKRTRGPTSDAN